jgi:hypothetical protein
VVFRVVLFRSRIVPIFDGLHVVDVADVDVDIAGSATRRRPEACRQASI